MPQLPAGPTAGPRCALLGNPHGGPARVAGAIVLLVAALAWLTVGQVAGGAVGAGPSRLVARSPAHGPARRTPLAGPVASSQSVVPQDCDSDDGIRALRDWSIGDLPVEPWRVLPGPDWRPYLHPGLGLSFFYPPSWSPLPLERIQPDRAGVRLLSPAGEAAFEVGTGLIVPAGTSATQASQLGLTSLLGQRTDVAVRCAVEVAVRDVVETRAALVAVESRGAVVAVQTFVFVDPWTGNGTVSYYAMASPAADFADLTAKVFLPILYQFLPGGGETPTPTPIG